MRNKSKTQKKVREDALFKFQTRTQERKNVFVYLCARRYPTRFQLVFVFEELGEFACHEIENRGVELEIHKETSFGNQDFDVPGKFQV